MPHHPLGPSQCLTVVSYHHLFLRAKYDGHTVPPSTSWASSRWVVAQLQPCREQKSKDTFTGEYKMLSFDTLHMNGNEQSLVSVFHTVHGVLKARILKWFVIPFSRDHILSELSTMTFGWPYMAWLIVSLS